MCITHIHFTHIYICKALYQHMRTSLLLLNAILFESAIFKLIAYPRSKVKEVKELLFRCHLRLIKTLQTDENPRHSQFLFPFLIIHSSEASPVARWLISKKSWQKYVTNYFANIQKILTKMLDKSLVILIFCTPSSFHIGILDWVSQLKLTAHEDLHYFVWPYQEDDMNDTLNLCNDRNWLNLIYCGFFCAKEVDAEVWPICVLILE